MRKSMFGVLMLVAAPGMAVAAPPTDDQREAMAVISAAACAFALDGARSVANHSQATILKDTPTEFAFRGTYPPHTRFAQYTSCDKVRNPDGTYGVFVTTAIKPEGR